METRLNKGTRMHYTCALAGLDRYAPAGPLSRVA